LLDKSLAEVHGPFQVRVHFCNHFREPRDLFDISIPGLLIQLRDIICVFHESRGLNDFKRISGCGQDDGDE
jgi:hypothetical protein